MSDKVINECLAYLSALFPKFPLTDATAAAYARVLQDVPDELLLDAVEDIGCRAKWFPAAGEIREAAFSLGDKALDIPTAYEAWDAALSKWNPPASKWLDHPLVDKAVRGIGGWTYLGCSSNLMADRARFIEAFDTFRDKEKQMERLPDGVRGRIEARIDEHKAKQVDEAITKLLKGKVMK